MEWVSGWFGVDKPLEKEFHPSLEKKCSNEQRVKGVQPVHVCFSSTLNQPRQGILGNKG